MPPNRFAANQGIPDISATLSATGAATGTAIVTPGGSSELPLALAPTGVAAGTYGSASLSAQLQINAAGQVVSVQEETITADGLSNPVTLSYTGDVSGGPTNFTGKSNVSTAMTLAATAVTAGTYGDATHVGRFTVDAKGRLTAASAVAIAVATFGVGAPVASGVTEGDTYYDTTNPTYVAYVWHSAAWHQVA